MKTQKTKVPYKQALEMKKVAVEVVEILKKGNVYYPKSTFLNIYDALIFLAKEIDKLKGNNVALKKAIYTCAENIDKLNEPDAVDGMNVDDVFAATHPDNEKWSIGSKDSDNKWKLHHGPFQTEAACLKIQGSGGYYILHYTDSEEMIKYYWIKEIGWVKSHYYKKLN